MITRKGEGSNFAKGTIAALPVFLLSQAYGRLKQSFVKVFKYKLVCQLL